MRIANIGVAGFVIVLAGIVNAQTTAVTLQPGARIRVTAPGALTPEQQAGRLIALRLDSLLLQPDGAAEVTIPRSAIGEIDTSLGRHTLTRRGLATGLLVGAATGAALGAAVWPKGACVYHPAVLFLPAYTSDCRSSGERATLGGMLGAAAGLVAGGLIGHAHQTESWQRVGGLAGSVLRMVPDHLAINPVPRGVGLSIGMRM